MAPIDSLLESLSGAIGSSPREIIGLSDAELCDHLDTVEQLGRLVDGLRIAAAAEVDARSPREPGVTSLSRQHGCATGAILVEQVTRVSAAEASRRVRVGRVLASPTTLTGEVLPAKFPLVAEAVASGQMGVDAAAAVVRHLGEASHTATFEQLQTAEAHLVDAAETRTADFVAVLARAWRERLDPDGAEPREEELRGQRRFVIGREINGLTPFSGLADPVNAALLRAAIAERTAPSRTPRFLDARDLEADAASHGAGSHGAASHSGPSDGAGSDGGNSCDCDSHDRGDAPVDPRLREQRAFDVLFGLLTAGIRVDRAAVGSRHGTATVTAVIRAEDLARGTGVAWIDDVLSPIATATTQELICDGGIRLQIEGSKGEILWEGVRERYFTPPQRRALAVRDGGCVWPNCTAPPSWCHAHHVIEWEHGGLTDVDNGALLCSFHHHLLHASEYRLRMVDGLPELQRPFGDREWMPVGTARVRLALTA